MTVQFAQVKGRLVQQEEILLIDSNPFSGTIHKKTEVGKTETSYLNGVKHGIFKEFYRSGKLKRVSLYKMGMLDGRYIEYFASGAKKRHLSYSEDLKNGICEEWNEDGSCTSLKTYYNDKLISIRAF